MKVKAVIFDLGGTIIDKYSLSPLLAIRDSFKEYMNVDVPKSLLLSHIGCRKDIHIEYILGFQKKRDFKDKKILLELFEKHCNSYLEKSSILPGVKEAWDFLRSEKIKIGSTTGFSNSQINIIEDKFLGEGMTFDCIVGGETGFRPETKMMIENFISLEVRPRNTIKVDDTKVGIQEGINAKSFTIGVYKYGAYAYQTEQIDAMRAISESKPEILISDVSELPSAIMFSQSGI